jgi:hypothetical protein
VALLTVSCSHRRCLKCTVSTDALLSTDGRAHLTRVIGSAVVANRGIHERINRSIESSMQNPPHAMLGMNIVWPATLQCHHEKPSGSDERLYATQAGSRRVGFARPWAMRYCLDCGSSLTCDPRYASRPELRGRALSCPSRTITRTTGMLAFLPLDHSNSG